MLALPAAAKIALAVQDHAELVERVDKSIVTQTKKALGLEDFANGYEYRASSITHAEIRPLTPESHAGAIMKHLVRGDWMNF